MNDVRQSHAVLDLPSRKNKGLKIERLLRLTERVGPMRVLEIGTGSGGIAHYFATHPTLDCTVTAVDVKDQRLVYEGYTFVLVSDTSLPFEDESFDVVLSNHVIEHVGDREAQLMHLKEIRRVLARGGIGYLAVPNRWMLVEPHYRLAFLSWLPRCLRTPYLRLRRKGALYDCEPLTMPELDRLLRAVGFCWQHLEVEALHAIMEIEGASGWAVRMVASLPDFVLGSMRRWIPTLICQIAVNEKKISPGQPLVRLNQRS